MSGIVTPQSHRARALMREKVTRQELLGSFVNCMKEIELLKVQVARLEKIITFHDNLVALLAEKLEVKPAELDVFMEKRAKAILEALREEAVRKGEDPDRVLRQFQASSENHLAPNLSPEHNLPESGEVTAGGIIIP